MEDGIWVNNWDRDWNMDLTGFSTRFRIGTRIEIALFISMLFGIWARLGTTLLDYDRY